MTIYIVLSVFLLLLLLVENSKSRTRANRKKPYLAIAFGIIFLMCVLRDSSVGRDIPGYERLYEVAKSTTLFDFSFVYYEPGYILLMQICNLLGLSFQWFLVVTYSIILIPIFLLIKRYSDQPILSVLTYVCYMFFEFQLTGLRQAISMSILLVAFMILVEDKRFAFLKATVVTILAYQFHRGAAIFLPFLVVTRVKNKMLYRICVTVLIPFLVLLRNPLVNFIGETMNSKIYATMGLNLGLNFFFTIALQVFFTLSFGVFQDKQRERYLYGQEVAPYQTYNLFHYGVEMMLIGVVFNFIFGLNTAARSYMNMCQIMIVLIPNSISVWEQHNRKIMRTVFIMFLLLFFVYNTLIPNNFDIIPYSFFWSSQ